MKKQRVNQYVFTNQDLFPDGLAMVKRYLRQFYAKDVVRVTYNREDGLGVLESIVSFTDSEVGYLQAVHDFGLPSVIATLAPLEGTCFTVDTAEEESEWE